MKWLYYKFIYRRLMRLAHRHGWHKTRVCYLDGDTLHVCDWCGLRWLEKRAQRVILSNAEQQALGKALRNSISTRAEK